jgi:hypothetical protein
MTIASFALTYIPDSGFPLMYVCLEPERKYSLYLHPQTGVSALISKDIIQVKFYSMCWHYATIFEALIQIQGPEAVAMADDC